MGGWGGGKPPDPPKFQSFSFGSVPMPDTSVVLPTIITASSSFLVHSGSTGRQLLVFMGRAYFDSLKCPIIIAGGVLSGTKTITGVYGQGILG